jgi:hypothetical protein
MPQYFIKGEIKIGNGDRFIPFESSYFSEWLARVYCKKMKDRGDKVEYVGIIEREKKK